MPDFGSHVNIFTNNTNQNKLESKDLYHSENNTNQKTVIASELQDWIDLMKKHEVSPAFIVLKIYEKAMNRVSEKILLITENTDKLSSVMSDLLTLSTSLSKIQNQLGAKKEVTKEDWDKFAQSHYDPQEIPKEAWDEFVKSHFNEAHQGATKEDWDKFAKSYFGKDYKEVTKENWDKFVENHFDHVERNHLTEIQSSYSKLIEDCKQLKAADVADFKPIVTAIEGVIDDFDTKIGDSKFSEDITKWEGDTSFQGDKRGTLQGDVVWLAKQFYEKNHDTDDNKGTVDYLSIWVQGINAAQQLGQGMSQQKVVELQAQMQFISSFSSSGQQSAQSSKEELSVMVHNQAGR